jgi:hypothetical protein
LNESIKKLNKLLPKETDTQKFEAFSACLNSLQAVVRFMEPRLKPTVVLCGGKDAQVAILATFIQTLLANYGQFFHT